MGLISFVTKDVLVVVFQLFTLVNFVASLIVRTQKHVGCACAVHASNGLVKIGLCPHRLGHTHFTACCTL